MLRIAPESSLFFWVVVGLVVSPPLYCSAYGCGGFGVGFSVGGVGSRPLRGRPVGGRVAVPGRGVCPVTRVADRRVWERGGCDRQGVPDERWCGPRFGPARGAAPRSAGGDVGGVLGG